VEEVEFAVDPLLNPAHGQTHELGFGATAEDGFADLEAPFPQARLSLHQAEFDAPTLHDPRAEGKSLASCSASSFKMMLRAASSWVSARHFQSKTRFSRRMYLSVAASPMGFRNNAT
jgi:hypothetical protein